MSLTKFTESINIIAGLDDKPSLTAEELKAKFDEADGKLKGYLNDTLTTEVEQLVATEKTSLQNLISSLSTSTTASINELRTSENAMIGDGYSTTQSYKIGDLCIYNNVLYRCTTAIEEGEAWNSSHWEQTNLGDEVRKSEVYSTEEKVVGTWIDGKPIYQCVLTVGSIPAGSVGHVPFSRTNIDEILDCQCFGRDGNNNWFPLSRAHPNYFKHQISIYYNYPDNEFSIEMGTEINIRKGYIVARYTKTTD